MQRFRSLCPILFFFCLACTNYSVSKAKTVPPILVSISSILDSNNVPIPNAYRVAMRITNQEPFFAGYKLYIGDNENAARNPADLNSGLNCASGPAIIPNQPIEYVVEISPDPANLPATGNRLCTYRETLTSGKYIVMRTLLLSVQPSNQGGNKINPSLPSNTLIVP